MITEPRYISRKQFQQRVNISKATFHRLAKSDPAFPKKIHFSTGCIRYRIEDIEAWEQVRIQNQGGTI